MPTVMVAGLEAFGRCAGTLLGALTVCAGIVSCLLIASVDVAPADVGGDQIIGDAAHRTVRSSKSKDDLAKGGRPIAHLPVVGAQGRVQNRKTCATQEKVLGHAM